MRDKVKMRAKLYELGKLVGLEKSETEQAKRTTKNLICVFLAVGFIALLGMFMITRLDSIGLWYVPPSIKDFNVLGRLF